VSVNADDNDQLQNYEVDSSSVNTPLNPLSPKGSGQARGDGVAEGNARGVSAEARNNDLILEILDDIEANLRKIHEHGKRAESIVKSMLLHSRGKSGNPHFSQIILIVFIILLINSELYEKIVLS